MKLTINRSRFMEALKKVQSAANAKNVNTVLGNVKMDLSGNILSLTTTNGEITLFAQVDCTSIEDGSTTVPVQLMSKIINKLAEGDVEIEETNSNMKVRAGKASFKVNCIPSEQFPRLPNEEFGKQYKIPVATLRDLINKTAYAQGTDETRRTLTSVLFEVAPDKLRCVASDGRRLALAEDERSNEESETVQYIIPQGSVSLLQKFLDGEGEVEISSMKTQVLFSRDEGKNKIYTKLIDGVYPNYMNVIPTEHKALAVIDRNMLIDAVERVSVMATNDNASVKMSFHDNMLAIEVKGDDKCDAQDELPIKYEGEKIDIIFNPKYVLDPLKAATSDEIKFEMTDGMKAAVIRAGAERFLCVLMPLRIAATDY